MAFLNVYIAPARKHRSVLFMAIRIVLAFFAAALIVAPASAADTNGFAVKFISADGKTADTIVLPNLWLFVEKGKPATPFLTPGKFTAEFHGFIHADLRSTYLFQAEHIAGAFKLEINGKEVLSADAAGGASELSKGVQFNKGPNAVKAIYTSGDSDASLRIGWTEKGPNVNPIPAAWIMHTPTPELAKTESLRLGHELFLDHRCAKCHVEKFASAVPELGMDAPSFDAIGARRGAAWLAQWILDPKSTRATAVMPALLHGAAAKEDTVAIAAFLNSLQTPTIPVEGGKSIDALATSRAIMEISKRSGPNAKPTLTAEDEASQPIDRNPIFERLHCTGCHNAPDKAAKDSAKISLKHVAAKFERETALRDFLKSPERHFTWTRMPNFKLADSEAEELASYLFKHADKIESAKPVTEQLVARGKELVQTIGCLNCHSAANVENRFSTVSLAKIAKEAKGCLAEKRDEKSKAPDFRFTARQREALLAFVKTDFNSLSRHSPMEFAARETRSSQCNACHGQIDLVPPMDVMGGKLKPEWTARFIGGSPFKVRADIHPKGGVWVDSRMPAFKSRAALLAEGIAAQQGYGPTTPDEAPVDEAAAKIGHKLLGKDNGLSCISCHGVNDMPALEVFESEGTNLGLAGARLLKPYFFRWMRNPLAIDPQSKMPAFFGEDGKSALTDYYEGDGEKQINALYEYMRLGETMAKPATGTE